VDNQSARFADLIHPEDRDFVWNYVQMRLTRRERYELSYRIIDRDGQTRWVWEQGRGIHSSRGEFLGLEGFITDVSSSRGAQEEARRRLFFDNAAGLLGFSLFLDRLQHLFRHAPIAGYPFALFHLAVDALDGIQAEHGTAMAERVMVESGKRLRVVHSDCNGAARHGDGFAVLIADFRPRPWPGLAPAARPPHRRRACTTWPQPSPASSNAPAHRRAHHQRARPRRHRARSGKQPRRRRPAGHGDPRLRPAS
jgi:GGDEF domain-containing protein